MPYITHKENIPTSYQEFLTHFLFILLCLALLIFFPTKGAVQELTKSFFFLVIIPALYTKFVLKENSKNFSLNFSEKKSGVFWGTMMFLFAALFFYVLTNFTPFTQNYRLPGYVVDNFRFFLIYELLLSNLVIFVNLFFFAGFVENIFRKHFSSWAIPISLSLFFIFFAIIKNINWQMIPLLTVITLGCFVSYKSRTIFYAYLSGLLFSFLLDAYLISLIK